MTDKILTCGNRMIGRVIAAVIAVMLLIANPFVTSAAQPTYVETASDAAIPLSEPVRKVSVREYVKARASRAGWTYSEWRAFAEIIYRESRWDPHAQNKHSSAYGLFQILKMRKGTPLEQQTTAAIRYIKSRYGSPIAALRHHDQHGWY